jgi:putative ABC transport system permease protein
MLSDLLIRLRAVFCRRAVEIELDDELRFHVEQQVQKYMQSGLAHAQATRRARLEFGGDDQIKEECREARGVHFLETFVQDVRYGARTLRKSPSFTVVAILTLAFGIGANAAVFSLVDWLALQPLPIRAPEQVTYLAFVRGGENTNTTFSVPELQEISDQTEDVFSDVTGLIFGGLEGGSTGQDGLTINGQTRPVQTVYVTRTFFSMLGINPHLGGFIQPSESTHAGADPGIVLSYRYWETRFNADPSIIGKPAFINGHAITVIGVAPKGFYGVTPIIEMQAYLPIGLASNGSAGSPQILTDSRLRSMTIFGRLRSDRSLNQAQATLNVVGQRLSKQFPRDDREHVLRVFPLRPPGIINGTSPIPKLAGLFLTLAGLVLFLACVNVANLLLIRASVRQGEMAVRAALGAARQRLIRQFLTETFLLAILGCIAGVAAGLAVSRLFNLVSFQVDEPFVLDFHFDWRVFAYALGAALVTTVIVGLVPAVRASRVNLQQTLHMGARSSVHGAQRLRSTFVALQIAGSLALLVVAGLFVRSLRGMQNADLGFDPTNVLNFTIDPKEIGYTKVQGEVFYQSLLERARALPGVRSASLAATVPLGEAVLGENLDIPGYEPRNAQPAPAANYNAISPGYFKTLGIPLFQGRDLNKSDGETSPRVAVVNATMAGRYWPNLNPVGKRFHVTSDPTHAIEIIGVAGNTRMGQLYGPPELCFYVPLAQAYFSSQTLQIRTDLAAPVTNRGVFGIIENLAPTMPIFAVRSMTQALDGLNGLLFPKLGALLAGVLGSLGLILAIVGVYGVVSYAVAQRTREIGIRVALGAQPVEILTMISRQGLAIIAIGVAVGVFAAFAVSQLLGDFLIGVKPTDPLTYILASSLLAFVALAACYLPARRAMRADPMVAVRYE